MKPCETLEFEGKLGEECDGRQRVCIMINGSASPEIETCGRCHYFRNIGRKAERS